VHGVRFLLNLYKSACWYDAMCMMRCVRRLLLFFLAVFFCVAVCLFFTDFLLRLSEPVSVRETFRVCGDGIVSLGEECDDGNFVSGDGCSAVCEVESDFFCSFDVPSHRSVCFPFF